MTKRLFCEMGFIFAKKISLFVWMGNIRHEIHIFLMFNPKWSPQDFKMTQGEKGDLLITTSTSKDVFKYCLLYHRLLSWSLPVKTWAIYINTRTFIWYDITDKNHQGWIVRIDKEDSNFQHVALKILALTLALQSVSVRAMDSYFAKSSSCSSSQI